MSFRLFGSAVLAFALAGSVPALAQTSTTPPTATPAAPQAAAPAAPALDRAEIEKIVRDYIMKNPEILLEAMQELDRKQGEMRQAAADRAISEHRDEIYNDPGAPVVGNPQGDVTIVEFFDYHCGYCKQVHPVIKAMLSQDDRIRLIYREMPILSENSRYLAFAALAAARQGKYREMHDVLMEGRSQVSKERLVQIATELKIDSKRLLQDMEDPQIAAAIDRNLDLARTLNITGTPGFLVGSKLVPGAIDLDTLKRLIAEARRS